MSNLNDFGAILVSGLDFFADSRIFGANNSSYTGGWGPNGDRVNRPDSDAYPPTLLSPPFPFYPGDNPPYPEPYINNGQMGSNYSYTNTPYTGNGYNATNCTVIVGQPVFITQPVMGDGLVHRANGQHTLFAQTTSFTGNIVIEATIGLDPANSTYLPVDIVNTVDGNTYSQITCISGNGNGNVRSFFTITGQYSWIRANISNIQTGRVELLKVAF